MRPVALFFALAMPLLAWADDKVTRADRKALSGTWVAVGGEAMGKEIPKDDLPFQWTFKVGGKAVFADRKRGGQSRYAYTIDASRKPKVIDITYEGPEAALKGVRQFGIYKIEKDKLTLCLTAEPGATEKDRPKRFTTKEGKVFLMRFKRAKAGK
jgi:uncharacterized protein (TIGR03067 family)